MARKLREMNLWRIIKNSVTAISKSKPHLEILYACTKLTINVSFWETIHICCIVRIQCYQLFSYTEQRFSYIEHIIFPHIKWSGRVRECTSIEQNKLGYKEWSRRYTYLMLCKELTIPNHLIHLWTQTCDTGCFIRWETFRMDMKNKDCYISNTTISISFYFSIL